MFRGLGLHQRPAIATIGCGSGRHLSGTIQCSNAYDGRWYAKSFRKINENTIFIELVVSNFTRQCNFTAEYVGWKEE
jgi:hypothetical protein